jgi:nucleotide-binding universal stress UspA family protein
MAARPELQDTSPEALPGYRHILLAADSSDHANQGTREAVALARLWGAEMTAAHVYAAKMHDLRFRQMEGGLPEQFRQEQELERQRDVHDDLITRGLSIITDCYLDQAERACRSESVDFMRCSLEGKNYRELVKEANSGKHDLLVLGALGLGAVQGGRLGTVCQRVVRRTDIDTLVIKDPRRRLAEGPIVVAVDGSPRAYGGLLTALALAAHWQVPVKAVAAFDPYYHYVAFNRIAGVLSEEAGKVFRFKDQEKLHEEIIDSGLARIYQGHLRVAEGIAADYGTELETRLLDGKPHDAIEKYLREVNPSLLVIGKLGIHADPELDIGGNAENLLRNVDCAVLLSQRQHRPAVDQVAEVTTSWTNEAEQRMQKVPSFARDMARMAILRYAHERGHTVVTERIVDEATASLMPGHAETAMAEIVAADAAGELGRRRRDDEIGWSNQAQDLLQSIGDPSLRGNLAMRAEKKARVAGASLVERQHLESFVRDSGDGNHQGAALHWQAPALARLMRVPEGFMRDSCRQRIEDFARLGGFHQVSLEVAEQGLAAAREIMQEALQKGEASADAVTPRLSKCPFANPDRLFTGTESAHADPLPSTEASAPLPWTEEAEGLLAQVPEGFCRDMTRRAAQTIAERGAARRIDADFVEQVKKVFAAGAEGVQETLPWSDEARARIARAPDMVRGMLVKEIEGWAVRNHSTRVGASAVEAVKAEWQRGGAFHLDPADARNQG